MQIETKLVQKPLQTVNLTQNLIQSITLLQYTSLELISLIEEITLDNPLIEVETNDAFLGGESKKQYIEDGKVSELSSKETFFSLKSFLYEQIIDLQLNKEEFRLLRILIESLDENGYLEMDENEACELLSVGKSEFNRVLTLLQSLDPIGIGARSLQECFLLQLNKSHSVHCHTSIIVKEYFEDLIKMNWNKISKELGLTPDEIKGVVKDLKKLNPKPGIEFLNSPTEYIIPDIVIEYNAGQWQYHFGDDTYFKINFDKQYYTKLSKLEDLSINKYLIEKINQYEWLKSSLEQRKENIKKVTKAIVKRQHLFFLNKRMDLEPMTMTEIAQEIGLNESTISRIVNNKYIRTPAGTFFMRNLFSVKVTKNKLHGEVSSTFIKREIKNIIESENRARPYSDQKIVDLLGTKDINISRRAAAKYRNELTIPTASERKNLYY